MHTHDRHVVVLMGDIAGSRKMGRARRDGAQRSLKRIVSDIEKARPQDLLTSVAITAGDAFQVVLSRPAAVVSLVRFLIVEAPEQDLHLGVGVGPVYTAFDTDPRAMDGPAFHNALDAVSERGRLRFRGFGTDEDRILNGISEMLTFIAAGWTPRQREIVSLLVRGMQQQEIAADLEVTKQSISKTVSTSGWKQYEQGEQALGTALEHFFGQWGQMEGNV